MRRFLLPVVGTFLVLLIPGCTSPPTLTSIQPNQGFPRQIVTVDGDVFFTGVRWDAGLASETEVQQSFLSARYFQIPSTAGVGVHPVKLRVGSDYSTATVNVTVAALSGVWPAPRIEDIGITSFRDNGGGTADIWLAVPVANVDPNATVQVDGIARTTIFTSAISNPYFNSHTASTYNHPVYHYGLLIAVLDDQPLGANLNVQVTNTDGLSGTRTYQLPANAANLDSDNDGLLDTWENTGFPAPSGATIDLRAMGCDPHRKDILVEADWIAAATPNGTIWATIETAFANAPVLNPNGSRGVAIHIDRGQGGAFTGGGTVLADHTTMDFGPNPAAGYTDFFTYKAASFNADRLNIFHYCVFGRVRPNGSSGRGEIWGNDFMVTFVTFGVWGTDIAEVGTFIHELGHNLGLRHGGIDNTAADANETFKPNQESTMNYRYQFAGVSNDCNFAVEAFHTYSQGMYLNINEPTVNENIGICDNNALDFNGSGTFTNGVAINTNASGNDADTTDNHINYDEWGNMKLAFTLAGSRWNSN